MTVIYYIYLYIFGFYTIYHLRVMIDYWWRINTERQCGILTNDDTIMTSLPKNFMFAKNKISYRTYILNFLYLQIHQNNLFTEQLS